jgi:heme/copper-type cytochrome/quinol oxidase subunit 1
MRLVFWNSIHLEVASDPFCLLINSSWLLVFIFIFFVSSGNRIISPENQNFYNILLSLHGIIMIFFLVMPGLFGGIGNYFVPIFQGSPEVVYPRVNNFSILILIISYLYLILSLISEFGGGTGWTLYPPLSTSFMSLSPSSTLSLIFSLLISGISSCLTSLNFWITILNLRSYYLTLKTMPLFPWSLLITASMLLLTLPILSGSLLLILSDLTLILVFWTSRSLHLNYSSIWDHFHNNFWHFTKNNLWEPINDLCHVLYFSSWKSCMRTSYVYCRFRK